MACETDAKCFSPGIDVKGYATHPIHNTIVDEESQRAIGGLKELPHAAERM
jgi:hypothetical protein